MSTDKMVLIKDFPAGPLDFYRRKASFDWKQLALFLESEDVIKYKNEICATLRNLPDFHHSPLNLSLQDERFKASKQYYLHKNIKLLDNEYFYRNIDYLPCALRIMMQLAQSSTTKIGIYAMFMNTVRNLGTSRHDQYIKDIIDDKFVGCYCLTEIGHGSNTQRMRTTATYDPKSERFVLNSPNFEAAKCWAGALGQTATHGLVYAQLYTPEPKGLHVFIVPIRDPDTLLPYPGVTVGDMGAKIGLNGIDNGFMMFTNYEIARENLLNRYGDVAKDGTYIKNVKTNREGNSASFGVLSTGRVHIVAACECLAAKALTIAIRYAAVRKQFGPTTEGEEFPILEYQSHQHRLLPYLAAVYAVRIFSNFFIPFQLQFTLDTMTKSKDVEYLSSLGLEIHAISSGAKPISSWTFRDAIQECRESCGGHGYLKSSGIGDLRNDHDVNLTYEGENHVLIQQTSNWLLKLWPKIEKRQEIKSHLKSIDFLTNYHEIMAHFKFTADTVDQVIDSECIMNAYRWLTCFLLKETRIKMTNCKDGSEFTIKNNTQVYYAKSLASVYIIHFILQQFLMKINEHRGDSSIKKVLLRLFSLYGLWNLEKFIPTLYQGGYASGSQLTTLIHDGVLKLCADLKDDAVALIDVIAPPDFILNSTLGSSDGQVYKRLQSAMMQSPNSMTRPSWWREMGEFKAKIKNNI